MISCLTETFEDDFSDIGLESFKEFQITKSIKLISNICIISVFEKKKLLAMGLECGSVLVKNLKNFETIFIKNKHNSFICSLLFSDCGNYLFSADRNGTIIKWNLQKKNVSNIISNGHQNYIITDMKIYENYLISCGFDSSIIFWNLKNCSKINSFTYHGEQFSSMYICPIKEYLFIGTNEGTLLIINLKNLKIVESVKIETSGIWSILPSLTDISIYLGTNSGELYQYFDDGSIKFEKIHSNRITEMIYFKNQIVTVSIDHTLKIIDFKTMKIILEKKYSNLNFTGVQKFDNKQILTCCINSTNLGIWDIFCDLHLYSFLSKNKKCDINFHFS